MIEIRIDGADTVAQVLHGTLAAVDPALRATGDELFGRIWEAADKHTKTGAMARSLKNSYRDREYLSGTIYSTRNMPRSCTGAQSRTRSAPKIVRLYASP